MARVAVIGADSGLGIHLIRTLIKSGYRVLALGGGHGTLRFVKSPSRPGQLFSVPVSILSLPKGIFSSTEAVISLLDAKILRESFYLKAVEQLTKRACEEEVRCLVGLSSLCEDGQQYKDVLKPAFYHNFQQAEPLYRACKQAIIVRPSLLFGAPHYPLESLASVYRFLPCTPILQGKYQPLHIGDMAQGIVNILTQKPSTTDFEMTGPETYTFRELMKIIGHYTQRPNKPLLPLPLKVLIGICWCLRKTPLPFPLSPNDIIALTMNQTARKTGGSLKDLGITPTPLECFISSCFGRFRATSPLDTDAIIP